MLALSVALAGGLIYAAFVQHAELRALTLTVALALVSSPLLWSHYLALLIVPLALLRPRLHWVWLMPVLMWVSPLGMSVHTWQVLFSWAAGAAMFYVLVRQDGPAGRCRHELGHDHRAAAQTCFAHPPGGAEARRRARPAWRCADRGDAGADRLPIQDSRGRRRLSRRLLPGGPPAAHGLSPYAITHAQIVARDGVCLSRALGGGLRAIRADQTRDRPGALHAGLHRLRPGDAAGPQRQGLAGLWTGDALVAGVRRLAERERHAAADADGGADLAVSRPTAGGRAADRRRDQPQALRLAAGSLAARHPSLEGRRLGAWRGALRSTWWPGRSWATTQIHTYLHLSSEVTDALWRGGYSMLAVAHHLGFGRTVGEGLLLATSAAAAAARCLPRVDQASRARRAGAGGPADAARLAAALEPLLLAAAGADGAQPPAAQLRCGHSRC